MAAGETLVNFTALHNEPPTTAYATYDTIASDDTVVGTQLVLAFDKDADESAEFGAIMPQNYVGTTGIQVTIAWASMTGTADEVLWGVQFKRFQADVGNLDTSIFATLQPFATDAPGTSIGEVVYVTKSIADGAAMDNIEAGEYFRIRVTRDVSGDAHGGDALLVGIEIKEE